MINDDTQFELSWTTASVNAPHAAEPAEGTTKLSTLTAPTAPAPTTLAGAREVIPTWRELSTTRIRDLVDAIDTAAKAIGLPAAEIPLSCSFLSEKLMNRPPRAYGLERKRRANVMSGLRFILGRFGLHDEEQPAPQALDEEWHQIWSTQEDYVRFRISRSFVYCSTHNIRPADVDEETAAAFLEHLRTRVVIAHPMRLGRKVVASWNRLAAADPNLGLRQLKWRYSREPYMRPLTDFPQSFQDDVATLVDRLGNNDLGSLYDDLTVEVADRPQRPQKPVRASTIALRVQQIRLAASALVIEGRSIDSIQSLRDLVEPVSSVTTILNFYWRRGEKQRSTFISGIAEILRQIAKHHCGLSAAHVQSLKNLRERVSPDRMNGICPRNRERLRKLIEPEMRGLLINLPEELFRQARSTRNKILAERLATVGTALAIMLVCPLRISNVLNLRIDKHLPRSMTGKRLISHIILSEIEVKNDAAIEWPLFEKTAGFIQEWIDYFRPAGGPWLFSSPGGKQRSLSSLQTGLSFEIERMIGARVNPHLLRHFAAWMFLKENPGAYELLRRILGHKSIITTIKAYTGLEADTAAQMLDKIIVSEGEATRLVAQAKFSRHRRTSKKGS